MWKLISPRFFGCIYDAGFGEQLMLDFFSWLTGLLENSLAGEGPFCGRETFSKPHLERDLST